MFALIDVILNDLGVLVVISDLSILVVLGVCSVLGVLSVLSLLSVLVVLCGLWCLSNIGILGGILVTLGGVLDDLSNLGVLLSDLGVDGVFIGLIFLGIREEGHIARHLKTLASTWLLSAAPLQMVKVVLSNVMLGLDVFLRLAPKRQDDVFFFSCLFIS